MVDSERRVSSAVLFAKPDDLLFYGIRIFTLRLELSEFYPELLKLFIGIHNYPWIKRLAYVHRIVVYVPAEPVLFIVELLSLLIEHRDETLEIAWSVFLGRRG